MHYVAIATDYDGTLAHHGVVRKETYEALQKAKQSGRKLILVTGRILAELMEVFPEYEIFDRIVAENGALLYNPSTRKERVLCERASTGLVQFLRERGVNPLYVGKAIVSTLENHKETVLQGIQALGLELHVIFNKGSIMILPSSVNKKTGLKAALLDLGISHHNVIGIGDAENDHALLAYSGCAVAVGNALAPLKERADIVTHGKQGDGVVEIVRPLLKDDLRELRSRSHRHRIVLGWDRDGDEVYFPPHGKIVLIAGPSGSGKSTVATAVLEAIGKRGYQFCVVDPEGDYENFPNAVSLGGPKQIPSVDSVIQLLEHFENPVVNLLGVSLIDRPAYFDKLFLKIQALKNQRGHPHWIVLDEAHHLLPSQRKHTSSPIPAHLSGILMITVHPDEITRNVLNRVDIILAVGKHPEQTIRRFAEKVGDPIPVVPRSGSRKLDVVAWFRADGRDPFHVDIKPGTVEHDRHKRKYAEGDLEEDSFYFRGPKRKLNLRAQNLNLFMQIGDGVDEETWLHHLKRHDYSRWVQEAIRDEKLAEKIREIEKTIEDCVESRAAIRDLIEKTYSAAA